MFTILHISDLHRSSGDRVSNDQLVSSLVNDRDRYTNETPRINPPDAIVVSGDLIQGVPVGESNDEIELQYEVAYRFLDELTNRFLEGDRSRVVLVPGNHDVDWNAAYSAMEIVEPEDWPSELSTVLRQPGSPYRWVLDKHELYRIRDHKLHESRFDHFNRFFARFYDGVDLPNCSPDHPYMRLFELLDERIIVAGFNSCFANDCFSKHGEIPTETIARADLDIRDSGKPYELRIAVWHHNTDGPPHTDDYMDVGLVRQMIGAGFRVGLHGHQHRSDVAPQQIHLPGPETMALVSAGSLCAGSRELPRGANRQYNLIEIADELTSATIHVREVVSSMNFAPRRYAELAGESFVELTWQPAANAAGVTPNYDQTRRTRAVLDAEAAFKNGRFPEVSAILGPHAAELDTYGRSLRLNATLEQGRFTDAIDYVTPPRSIDELTILVRAYVQLRQFPSARQALEDYATVVGLPPAARTALEEWIRGEELLHG